MAITTTSVLAPPVQQSFSYKLLAVPVPNMIHNLLAVRKVLPANGGDTLRMRRYNPLSTAIVPLGNTGVTPPAQTLTAVNIDARIDYFGTYIILNEQVTLQAQDPVLNEAAARLGVSLRQSEDELTRNMMASTASFVNCAGGVNGDVPTEITRSDIDGVVSSLLNNDAYTITDNIEGADKFATAPVRDAYWAMCSATIMQDLESVTGFLQKNQYPSPMSAARSEWGAVGSMRFLISSIGSTSPNASALANTVLNIFCVGKEAYASIEQDRYSASFIYRPPIFDGPLALNASVGYTYAQVPRILNDLWLVNLRATLA